MGEKNDTTEREIERKGDSRNSLYSRKGEVNSSPTLYYIIIVIIITVIVIIIK